MKGLSTPRVLDRNCRTKVLQQDLAAARAAWLESAPDDLAREKFERTDFLLYRNREGRYADFHAFRHATGTFLAAGNVNPKVAKMILRHSDFGLTMNTYSHAYREDEALAIEKLPDLDRRPQKKRQADAG
jgi:integrase